MAEKTIKIKYIICQRIGLKWKYNSQHFKSRFFILPNNNNKKKMHILSLDNPKF